MIEAFRCICSRISLKSLFLHSYLAFFPYSSGAVNDEHSERFHQDVAIVKKRCKGKRNVSVMGDYCWFLQKQSKTKCHCSGKRVKKQ